MEERRISAEELFQAAKDGTLEEAWGTGTAAVVSPSASWPRGTRRPSSTTMRSALSPRSCTTPLTGIQWGRVPDPHGWIMKL